MTVFVYDNTKIDVFTTFDGGDITVGSSENIDYGDINQNVEPERDENFFFVNDRGLITATADIVPFGSIEVVDGRDEFGRGRSQWIPENANTVLFDVNDSALEKASTPWVGSGTIHEIGSGLERIVIPDLGAAGPVIFIPSGTAEESISRGNYDGAGTITKSGVSATDLDQVYPYNGSGTLTLSGTTTTPYDEAYLPVIKNAFRAKGGDTRLFDVEKVIYNYARSESDIFEKEDNGTITVREGASFDDLNVTFDETITDPLAKERSFSDEDQVEFVSYGSILDTPTSAEDYGVIEQKLQGGIFFDEYQSTFVKGNDAVVRGYTGSGTFKKEGSLDLKNTYVFFGSGTATFSGTNFFSQAPQSTVFGVGDTITASGSANEAFVPATVDNTVLFDISGTGGQARSVETAASTALIRPAGSVSGIKLTLGVGARTVLFDVSGGATDVTIARADGNVNLFDITGGMSQGVPVYTPSWFSPLGDQVTEELDWGLITDTPTQPYEDWGVVNTNDETIPKEAENWGFLLPDFNYVQIGGQHYPNREVTFSIGESSLVVDTGDVTGIATFLLSEDLDIAAAIQYESSGITGIATYKGAFNFSGANWFSQAVQHRSFGLEGEFTISGTAGESITPFIPEGSGSLFKLGGAAESSTKAYLVGDYQYLSGNADTFFVPHVTGVGIATFSQGREPYQTYSRKINIPDDELGGILTFTGKDIFEKNTDSYNESSISFGSENEDYGLISREDVGRGFGLNVLGIGMSSVDSLDNSALTFDSSTSDQTYDEAVGGVGVLPSFDKNQQYNINFASNSTAEDYGVLGFSSVGGRPYTRTYPTVTGFDQQSINKGYIDYGWIDEPTPTPSLFPYGSANFTGGMEQNVPVFIPFYSGTGTITISGSAPEAVAVASSTTSLFDFVGTAKERLIAQTPEGTVLFDVSGVSTERTTNAFVGSGDLTLSRGIGISTYSRVIDHISPVGIQTFVGSALVASSFDPPEGTYLHIFGGAYSDLKVGFAAQSSKAVMRLSGELTHPDIDYTPHYGIDRNIGIETGITILPGGAGGEYGDPGIVTTRFIPKYTGDTPILTFSGRSISRTNAPISTHGVIYILGIGTDGNGVIDDQTGIGDLSGVEFGAKERFIPATEIGAGSLLFDFQTTGAEARPIKVFGYYGDDKDPGTSGQITIRQEGGILTIEKIMVPEIGSGTFTYSGAGQDEKQTFSEVGSGSLFAFGGIAETTTAAELVAGTSIFNGEADIAFSAQTPEDTATLTLSGTGLAQRRYEFDGSGTLTLRRDINPITGVRLSAEGSGTLFGLGSGAESITIPSAARAILTDITGAAEYRPIQVFQDFIPSGTLTLSGELTHPDIDYTPAYTASGTLNVSGVVGEVDVLREVGVGIATFSGSAVLRFTADSVEGTVLFDLKGASALTEINQVYGYYGDDKDPGTSGTFTIAGIGGTRKISVFQDFVPSGTITLSNTPLVHPFVDYTPSIGIGVAVLYQTSGTAAESFTKGNYTTQGFFKGLAGSKQAFARATYVGIGQVNTFGAGQTEYVVFEQGRTYVVII